MNLQQKIDEDLKESMKARQADRLSVLRMLKAALKNVAIEKGGPAVALEDSEVIAAIRKQVKQRQDSIESYAKGGRPDLAAKEEAELAVLNAYLPQQLSAEALAELVKTAIAETGATSKAQMGLVMKLAKEKAEGRADGKALSLEVQRQLS